MQNNSLKGKDIDFMRKTATCRDIKNGKTRRISLSKIALNCLQDQRNQTGKQPEDVRSEYGNLLKKINLDNVRFHSLRYTAALCLAMNEAFTLEIAKLLGHTKYLPWLKSSNHISILQCRL